MNALLSLKKALLLCTVVLLALTFTSWRGGTTHLIQATQDTVPQTHDKKIVDLDQALNELDRAKVETEKSLRDIDWNKVNVQINDAMKDLDVKLEHMNVDLKKSLQDVDVDKMKQDVNNAVAKIDWDKIKQEIAAAKDVDMDKVKADIEKAKIEIQKQKPEIEKSLRDARENIEKAKKNLTEYKTFLNDLERDGLINEKEGYKIEHRDGKLIINGKEQPASVYDKYRAFLEKNKTFTLEKNLDGINLKDE